MIISGLYGTQCLLKEKDTEIIAKYSQFNMINIDKDHIRAVVTYREPGITACPSRKGSTDGQGFFSSSHLFFFY